MNSQSLIYEEFESVSSDNSSIYSKENLKSQLDNMKLKENNQAVIKLFKEAALNLHDLDGSKNPLGTLKARQRRVITQIYTSETNGDNLGELFGLLLQDVATKRVIKAFHDNNYVVDNSKASEILNIHVVGLTKKVAEISEELNLVISKLENVDRRQFWNNIQTSMNNIVSQLDKDNTFNTNRTIEYKFDKIGNIIDFEFDTTLSEKDNLLKKLVSTVGSDFKEADLNKLKNELRCGPKYNNKKCENEQYPYCNESNGCVEILMHIKMLKNLLHLII